MRFRYDPEADAAYLQLSDAPIVDSEMVRPGVVLDYDADERVVGIELLHLRKFLPEADPTRLEHDTAASPH